MASSAGWDSRGVPISRSGPATSRDNDALPGEAWDSRGAKVSATKTDNTDVKSGRCYSPAIRGPSAGGNW